MNKDLKELLTQINDPASKDAAIALFENMTKTNKSAEQVAKALKMIRKGIVDSNAVAREFTESFGAALQNITRSNVGLNLTKKAQRGLLSNAEKFQNYTAGYNKLTVKQLETLKEQAVQERERLNTSANIIRNTRQLGELSGEALKNELRNRQDITEAEKDALLLQDAKYENINLYLEAVEDEIKVAKEINAIMGLTGATLNNLNRIGIRALGGLGVNLATLEENFREAELAAEDMAKKILLDAPEKVDTFSNKLKAAGAALPGIGKALMTAVIDPLTVGIFSLDSLIKGFNEIQDEAVQFGRLTGVNISYIAGLNDRFATTAQYLKVLNQLTEELGFSAQNVFTPDVIAGAAETQNLLGLSVEQAGKLALITQTTSKDFDLTKNILVDTVGEFNRANRTAVAQGKVLTDIANTSDEILISFKNQPTALASAASAARRLGLTLERVNDIASSLIDFESSISNELEAQLLTGRDLNLARARELALVNDIEGLSRELFENSASIAEFSNMNRISQEAQAKALGLSRQELARIALQRSLELGLTDKQLENAANITAEDLERVRIQDRFRVAITKVSQALVGPVESLAAMAENTLLISGAFGLMVGKQIPKFLRYLDLSITRLTIMAGLENSRAISTITSAIASTAGIATLSIIGGITAATLAYKSINKKVDDAYITPQQGLVVSGPKGSIQLNKDDSVIAGTNLGGGRNSGRTEQLLERLVAAVEKGGNVYMDGSKVGETLAIGLYKG